MRLLHSSVDEPAAMDIFEESDGTQRLLDLAPVLYHSKSPSSVEASIFVIDELERSLHPLLTRLFLGHFLGQTAGPTSQLIFTTHDTNLLDLALLPRDAVWFVEKNRQGASSVYSLAEFNGDQLDKLGGRVEEGYLQGRFGAIPFFGDLRRLGWSRGPEAG
jgi:hypothetical protein